MDFTTVIFKLENNVATDAWSYFPQTQKPDSNLINDVNSLVSYSAKNKKMVIISDIEKERNKKTGKRKISDHCLLEKGSAICYPIITGHTKGNIPLAIRITSSSNFFDEESKALYKQILENFKSRILIEYALNELKEQSISHE